MLLEQCSPWIVLQLFGHELICPGHGGTQEITKADQEQEDQCSPFQQSCNTKEASFCQGRLDCNEFHGFHNTFYGCVFMVP